MHFKLKCSKPKPYPEQPRTLGEYIRKRRMELGLTQGQAAALLGVKPWTVVDWETCRFKPTIRSMPAIFGLLGFDPFPPPATVGEQLLQTRRRRGWSIGEAARQLGVDQTTWRNWEHGGLILFRKHRSLVAEFLRLDERQFASEMRARWNGKHRRWDSDGQDQD